MYHSNPRPAVLLLWITLFLFIANTPILRAQHNELKSTLEGFMKASQSGNTEQLVEYIHPELIDKYGGREKLFRNKLFIGLQLYELQDVSEILTEDNRSYASASYKGTMEMNLEKMKGEGGSGMAISAILMKLKSEYGSDNIDFDKETYIISISDVDATVIAILDPEYSTWKILPANGGKSENIVPASVKSHFQNLLLLSLEDEIREATKAFIRTVENKDYKEESEWFASESDYFTYKSEKGLDAAYSFTALDTIYWATDYEEYYVAMLAFSGKLSDDPNFKEDHPFYLNNDDLIMLAIRKKVEPDWKFIWARSAFRWLPAKLSPAKYFATIEEEEEEKRRTQDLIDFNKEINDFPDYPDMPITKGKYSAWEGAGMGTYSFTADGQFNYYYEQSNGYNYERTGTYEYLEEERLISLKRQKDGRYKYLKQLSSETAIISSHHDKFPEEFVFYDRTKYILLRDSFTPGTEISIETEKDLEEKQRSVLFRLMLESGMRISWTNRGGGYSSQKIFLEKLPCSISGKPVFEIQLGWNSWTGLSFEYDMWAGRMAEWDTDECVITMDLARKLVGNDEDPGNLIGKAPPCNPEMVITGILLPNEGYKQEVVPKDVPLVFRPK